MQQIAREIEERGMRRNGDVGALGERCEVVEPSALAPRLFVEIAAQEFLDTIPNARVEKPFDVPNLRALVRGLLPKE